MASPQKENVTFYFADHLLPCDRNGWLNALFASHLGLGPRLLGVLLHHKARRSQLSRAPTLTEIATYLGVGIPEADEVCWMLWYNDWLYNFLGTDGKKYVALVVPEDFDVDRFIDSLPLRLRDILRPQRRRRYIPQHERIATFEADQYECVYCGSSDDLSIDHIDPNGANKPHNFVTACKSCNSKKHARTPSEAGMEMGFGRFAESQNA